MSLVRRQSPSKREGLRRGLLAFVLALVGHGAALALLVFLSLLKLNVPEERKPQHRAVELRGLSDQQWAQNRGDTRRRDERDPAQRAHAERQSEPKKKEQKVDPTPKGQVVDVAPGNGQQDPNAEYLAESNNAVKKQTRAKETTAFYRNAMPKRTSPHPQEGNGADAVDKAQAAGNNGIGQDDRPLKEGAQKRVFEVPDVKKSTEVAMRETDPTGPGTAIANHAEAEEMKGNSNRLRLQPGSEGGDEVSQGRAGTPGVANLLPSPAVLDKIVGAAANDHLKDVDVGDGTYLNTKEWKYASFFNRVKQSVGMHWDPGTQLRLRDPTGNIYGGRDRYTVLNVTLNPRGQVKEIFVEKSSGLDFLDLEAIHSFERAQPFPNPPPGLVVNDDAVRFSFGFFLEMSGSPRMRLFRSAN